jgi:hypothetical protein
VIISSRNTVQACFHHLAILYQRSISRRHDHYEIAEFSRGIQVIAFRKSKMAIGQIPSKLKGRSQKGQCTFQPLQF